MHLIVSSVQLLTSNPLVESWGHFPASKARLLALLAEARPASALVLSGDVHFAEFLGPAAASATASTSASPASASASSASSASASPPSADAPSAAPLSSLLEVTSSGLTHSCGLSGLARLACATVLDLFRRHRLQLARPPPPSYDAAPHADAAGSIEGASSVYSGLNFGTIDFEWGVEEHGGGGGGGGGDGGGGGVGGGGGGGAVHVRIHDVHGAPVMEQRLALGLAADEEARRWRGALEMPSPFDEAAALCDRCALCVGAALLCLLALRRCCARGRTRMASVGKVE